MFSGSFQDIDQMSDTPTRRGSHHRRAQSESFLHFPDDILLDPDLDLLENSINPNSRHTPMLVDSSAAKSDSSCSADATLATTEKAKPSSNPSAPAHLRSLSVDADFFDGVLFGGFNSNNFNSEEREELSSDGRPGHHRRRYSMDGTSSFDAEESSDAIKKAMPPEKLSELALIDPKRAKRILANRQSAARSKERKIHYTNELERKVQTLQTEATTLSTQVTMLQRDTSGLTAENRELKLRLQAMEQHAHLREALNENLRDEVQRLKIVTGHIPQGNGSTFNGGIPPRFSPQSSQLQYGGNQTQQNHTLMQPQIARSGANNRNPNQPLRPSFLDFN